MGAFDWVQKSWAFNFKFAGLSVIFWLLLFAYEFYVDIPVIGQIPGGPGILEQALVRSFSFSGVIFISLALLSSVAFKFRPLLSKYAFVRKNLGEGGALKAKKAPVEASSSSSSSGAAAPNPKNVITKRAK